MQAAIDQVTDSSSRKEEFQKYLEKSGVVDALTSVLVELYKLPERPQNAVEFVKEKFGTAGGDKVKALKEKLDQQEASLKAKTSEIQDLRKQLEELRADSGAAN